MQYEFPLAFFPSFLRKSKTHGQDRKGCLLVAVKMCDRPPRSNAGTSGEDGGEVAWFGPSPFFLSHVVI